MTLMSSDDTKEDRLDTTIGVDDVDNSETATDGVHRSDSMNRQGFNRRTYLQLLCGGIIATGLLYISTNDGTRLEYGGPPAQLDRTLAIEDRFERSSLNTDIWTVGWGWGQRTKTSSTRIVPENVKIHEGNLLLMGSQKNGDILAGGINTRGKITVGPGSYFEARIKFPDRDGFLPAFWAKPNDGTWPPEIDVVELFQKGDGHADTHHSHHTLHYSTSTQPGDRSTHESTAKTHMPGDDLTENFHIYGVDWQQDRIVHYVDRKEVMTTTDSTILSAMAKAAPFYLLCSLEINHVGTANTSETWDESVVIDWIRIWK